MVLSLVPFASHQRHTFPVGGQVYEDECTEIQIIIPGDAKIDLLKNQLSWDGEKGRTKSTAKEIFALAQAGSSGFRMA